MIREGGDGKEWIHLADGWKNEGIKIKPQLITANVFEQCIVERARQFGGIFKRGSAADSHSYPSFAVMEQPQFSTVTDSPNSSGLTYCRTVFSK